MSGESAETTRRIAIELDRLGQEIVVIRHVLDDGGPNCRAEMARRLSYLATCANRLAGLVGGTAEAEAAHRS